MTETLEPDAVRVSTLELFFDLVFVFTITQLTGVLVSGGDAAAALQVMVMLLIAWWMYDAYAWLTNAIPTERVRYRLTLIGAMGGFLVIALAIPDAYESAGLAFGLGYLVVVLLHGAMYVKGTSVSEVAAILRIVPFSLVGATSSSSVAPWVARSSGCYGQSRRHCSGSRRISRPLRGSSSRRRTSSSATGS